MTCHERWDLTRAVTQWYLADGRETSHRQLKVILFFSQTHAHVCTHIYTRVHAHTHQLQQQGTSFQWSHGPAHGPDVAVRCCPLLAITTPVGDSCRLALSLLVYTLFPAYCTSAPWLGNRARGRVELVTARSLNTPSNGCGWQPLLWCLQRPSLGQETAEMYPFYLSFCPSFHLFFSGPFEEV